MSFRKRRIDFKPKPLQIYRNRREYCYFEKDRCYGPYRLNLFKFEIHTVEYQSPAKIHEMWRSWLSSKFPKLNSHIGDRLVKGISLETKTAYQLDGATIWYVNILSDSYGVLRYFRKKFIKDLEVMSYLSLKYYDLRDYNGRVLRFFSIREDKFYLVFPEEHILSFGFKNRDLYLDILKDYVDDLTAVHFTNCKIYFRSEYQKNRFLMIVKLNKGV